MADSPEKTGGYKSVRTGTDGFKGTTGDSYDGKSRKEVAPNVYKSAQEPRDLQAPSPVIGGGKHQPDAHGYHVHSAKNRDGVLRNSGHPGASRLGKKK